MMDDDDLLEVEEEAAPEAVAEAEEAEAEADEGEDEEEAPRTRRDPRTERRFAELTRQAAEARRERDAAKAEAAALRGRVDENERAKAAADIEAYQQKKADVNRRLREAREAGDTDKEMELEEERADIDFRLRSTKIYVESAVRNQQQAATQQPQHDPEPDAIPLSREEAERANQRINVWARDAKFADWTDEERADAIKIEKDAATRIRRGTNAFYRLVSEELKAKLPDRARAIDYATARQLRQKAPTPPVEDDEDEAPAPRAAGQVRRASAPPSADDGGGGDRLPHLSPSELRRMERMNLDPKDKAARYHWARGLRLHGQA